MSALEPVDPLVFGALGDGQRLDTVALQAALDAAATSCRPLRLTPGRAFRSGSLFLKSGTVLEIPAGSSLIGSTDLADYPLIATRIAGIEMMRTSISERGELGSYAIHEGSGVKNPLGYVGVVMAGANDPPDGSPDRGVLSGATIWGLDLSGMELAVLSACETGLGVGDRTGSAGVHNLALAFYVAGCDNVIASLWKVDDEATAALMAKFYHELWVNGRPAVEALREAQLLVYRRPDLIPAMALASIAAGADGVHIEVHSCPEKALSDGQQALLPGQYSALMVQIRKLAGRTTERGMTLVPVRMYFKNGRVKVAISLAKGKKEYDKRETIKRREAARETRAAIKSRR